MRTVGVRTHRFWSGSGPPMGCWAEMKVVCAISLTKLSPDRAMLAALVSEGEFSVCWRATGNMAATMMKPMPRIMTAKRISVKENAVRALRDAETRGRADAGRNAEC